MDKLRCLPAALIFVLITVTLLIGCAQDYEVSLDVKPEGAGEVTGSGIYEEGEEAEVTAKPGEEYEFDKWLIDEEKVSFDKNYKFTIQEDKDLKAKFVEKEYEVRLEASNGEKGAMLFRDDQHRKVISSAGSKKFNSGEKVTVEADPKEEDILFNYEFKEWTKNGKELSSDKSYEFEIEEDIVLKAHFDKRVADEDVDPALREELERLSLEELGEKVEGGVLKLDTILEDERSLLPSTALTHIKVDGNLIELGEFLFMRDLKDSAPNLADQIDADDIKYYFGDNMLFSNEDIRIALEENWDELICPYFAEQVEEQEAILGLLNVIRDLSLSPGENKMAIGMDNMGCAFRIGTTGIIDMENNDFYFTNISGGFHNNHNWSPDSEHVAYSSGRKVDSYLYVDNVTEKRNAYTLTPEKLNSVLDQEGMKTLLVRESLLTFKELTWTEDGQTLYFLTDMTNVNWEEGKESEIKAIEWKLDLQTGDFSIENVKK